MARSVRKIGIDVLDDVPWGTHLCQFYHTKEDLIEILVPYFKAGLENNEFCMWVTLTCPQKTEPVRVLDWRLSKRGLVNGQERVQTRTDHWEAA